VKIAIQPMKERIILLLLTLSIAYPSSSQSTTNGEAIAYHDNGEKKSKGSYLNGEKAGKWTYWFENGVKQEEGNYNLNGERNGNWTYWSESGIKSREGKYENGEMIGVWSTYYKTGELQVKDNYSKDEKTGVSETWYRNGQLMQRCNYDKLYYSEDDKKSPECSIQSFYDSLGNQTVTKGNGQAEFSKSLIGLIVDSKLEVSFSGNIKKGKREGEWTVKSLEGAFSAVEYYKNGKFINGKSTDQEGKAYEYTARAVPAQPVNGLEPMYKYIKRNMEYPKRARRLGIEGRVFVQFVVAKDGSIRDTKVVKGIDSELDEMALNTIQNYFKLFKWVPSKVRGLNAEQRIILPVTFQLG
ncbi:MAG: TonB family protein, partial [Bacteroidota bacterium]